MTIEQEIQFAAKAAFVAYLEDVDFGESAPIVHAVKLDNDEESDDDAEGYPCIVIDTSTPVPIGNKSAIANVPLYIRCLSYLPNDRKREAFSLICEAVYRVMQDTEEWETYQSETPPVDISAIMIESSEEPAIAGMVLEQRTVCTVAACIAST